MISRFILALTFLAVAACSKSHGDPIGQTTEALDAGAAANIVGNAHTPSVVASHGKLALAFTNKTGLVPQTRWGSFNGTTWSICDVNNPSNCNGGTVTGAGVQTWLGKGAVAADGHGNVVYASLASDVTNATSADLVVAMVSTTDGTTYTHGAQLVNASGGECDPATEDAPGVTVDMTTSPETFWFVWRHKGASSFGGCVRRAKVSSGSLVWLDEVRSVGGMDREDDGNPNMGQGALRIAAGDGIVSIGYSNNDQLQTCPSKSLISMAWGSVVSFNNGIDWSNTSVAYHTDHFLSCPFGSIQNGIRAFDYIRSQDGNYYLGVADWNGTGTVATFHLFMNEGGATPVLGFPSDSHVWREFCPAYQDTPDGGPITGAPAGNWTRPGTLCTQAPPPFATYADIMLPALASDGQSRISFLYLGGSDALNVHPIFHGGITPRVASTGFEVVDPLGSNSSRPGGSIFLDQCAMTAWNAQTASSCGVPGDFYPIWVFAQGSTSQTLQFARVSL